MCTASDLTRVLSALTRMYGWRFDVKETESGLYGISVSYKGLPVRFHGNGRSSVPCVLGDSPADAAMCLVGFLLESSDEATAEDPSSGRTSKWRLQRFSSVDEFLMYAGLNS